MGERVIAALRAWVQPGSVRWRFLASQRSATRVLDLGCGPGRNSLDLHDIAPKVELHGVDVIGPGQVAGVVSYQVCDLDAATLPYPNDHFDAIVFTHVIEHLQRPLQLGAEIRRVLRPSGRIYVETPNWTAMLVPSFGIRRDQHFPFNFFDDPSHVKPWTKQGLYDFLSQACSLEVERVGTVRNWWRVPFDLPAIAAGLLMGRRHLVIAAFWNLYGWCIYGVGVKGRATSPRG